MSDTRPFLLEIGTEEIPAGYLAPALAAMERLFREALDANLLTYSSIKTSATPRRLVLHTEALAERQPDREVKIVGPPAKIAFDQEGNPTKAAQGFARKNGVEVQDLIVEKTEKGDYIAVEKTIVGRDAGELLQEILPELISKIPFPKSMRWGAESFRFARPIRWIVALFGADVIPFQIADVSSGRKTLGHRFMSKGWIELPEASYSHYRAELKEAYCLVSFRQRRNQLLESATEEVQAIGGTLVEDQDLVDLNTNLTEFPSATCGTFDERFLKLPECVLITCMKEHQKYFAVKGESGRLMAAFVAINNTRSPRPELVKKGHERVLSARLADAAFFFKEDTKKRLEEFVPELAGMIFHQKLGTLLDKTNRVVKLAEFLAGEIAPEEMETAKRAAWLCKADLCSEMVGEFPTLQGQMGREYALISGEPEAVAIAIEEHYMPVRSGGALPKTKAGIIVSIADKIDTITATFAIGLKPSGTQDPYALRRQALGIIHIVLENEIEISLKRLVKEAISNLADRLSSVPAELGQEIIRFIERRFANDLRSKGFDHDVVEAGIRADFDSIYDCYQRILAIRAVRPRPEFEPISIAFKRVMNILKGFDGGSVEPGLFEYREEKELYDAYLQVKEVVSKLIKSEGGAGPDAEAYQEALLRLLTLKPHIDAFFDNVMVMVEDERVRENRLAMLWLISRLFLSIGDLSAIAVEGT